MLHVRKMGEGSETVVLVHGFLGSGANTQGLARAWGAKDPSLRFLLPDLTGHGRSPALPEGADLFTLAEDIVKTARAEGAQGPLRIVGHSLGGRVGLAARIRFGEEIGQVVLLDVGPGRVPEGTGTAEVLAAYQRVPARVESREEMRSHLQGEGLSQGLTEWLLSSLEREADGYRWRVDREALGALHERINDVDLWPAIEGGGISMIRGGASSFVSDAELAKLREAGCKVATLEGADHYIHFNKTQEVVDLLTGERPWDP